MRTTITVASLTRGAWTPALCSWCCLPPSNTRKKPEGPSRLSRDSEPEPSRWHWPGVVARLLVTICLPIVLALPREWISRWDSPPFGCRLPRGVGSSRSWGLGGAVVDPWTPVVSRSTGSTWTVDPVTRKNRGPLPSGTPAKSVQRDPTRSVDEQIPLNPSFRLGQPEGVIRIGVKRVRRRPVLVVVPWPFEARSKV